MQSKKSEYNNDIASLIPDYSYRVHENLLNCEDSKILFVLELDGIYIDSLNNKAIDSISNSIHNFVLSLSNSNELAGNLSAWTHIQKSKNPITTDYEFDNDFMAKFSSKYLERFKGNKAGYKVNYYVTFVYKYKFLNEGIKVALNLANSCKSFFQNYSPTLLGVKDDCTCEITSFLNSIFANSKQKIPLATEKVKNILADNVSLNFSYDSFEIRESNSTDLKYGVCYELSSYPVYPTAGMWNFLLEQDCEFVLSQSFIFLNRNAALKEINSQKNKLNSSGEAGDTQINELEVAKEMLSTAQASFGSYHFGMVVFGETSDAAIKNGQNIANGFVNNDSILRRSNYASLYTLASILPTSKIRPLHKPRSLRNLLCGFSLHNEDLGKEYGNPLVLVGDDKSQKSKVDGTSIMPFKTVKGNNYFFNTHYTDKTKNETGKKITGHTLILGQSGAGKTTVLGTILGFLDRFNPSIFTIDYNRSLELMIRALGGEYFDIKLGVKTGLNPFQLPFDKSDFSSEHEWEEGSSNLKSFLYSLVNEICSENGKLSASDALVVKNAVDTVLTLDKSERRLSKLLSLIQEGELKTRLAQWCEITNGKYAWALDNEINTINPLDFKRIGFDTTDILKTVSGKLLPVSPPILATLFYYKELMQKDGSLMVTAIEEFWMPCNSPLTSEYIKTGLKAGRTKNEFLILSSQSPEDAINCVIFDAINQQTVTKIFLPNVDAEFENSYEKTGMNEKTFNILKSLDKESRKFIVKQSSNINVLTMDLHGFDDFLPVISGTIEDIEIVKKIRQETKSNDPKIWIPRLINYKKTGSYNE